MKNKGFCIKAVLFDFDGTLTKPGALDFPVIKQAIGCPDNIAILEYIESLKDSSQREKALSVLDRFEIEAAADSEPNSGAEELIPYLRSKGLRVGIISRNSYQSIERALKNFKTIGVSDFDLIISRDDPVKPKPSADGVLFAAEKLELDVKHILVVGDYIFDIQAGHDAGAITVLLNNKPDSLAKQVDSDFTISRLEELKQIVRMGLPLPQGKLPNDLLEDFLDQFPIDDPSVLIRPGIGEDIAAVKIDNEEVLVLKSDPITFATDSIGQYAVIINANDIATSGAVPRWFLSTLLFPYGITASEIWQVMNDLHSVCRHQGIALCGGHTEITDAVSRPVITGMLVGTIIKRNLIDKRNIRPGDSILLTKAVAVEGTAIIAREFRERLKGLDMPETEIEKCSGFLSNISILKEAQIASRSEGISAMHDVTEGGLATALMELGVAGHHRIRVDIDSIPVFPETKKICRMLDIDPLGLIGSGSLLICCKKNFSENLITAIREAGIDVTCIGEVLEEGQGVDAIKHAKRVDWPTFEVDEITRLF
jgi:HAD superfamily hydrolase (TIGR01509 family)